MFQSKTKKAVLMMMLAAMMVVSACGGKNDGGTANTPNNTQGSGNTAVNEQPQEPAKKLSGRVEADGSSTVFPITEAIAEDFRVEQPDVQVTVGVSGTGGGFKRFCAGETAMSNASRHISSSEKEACQAAGIEYIELEVAFDGLSVVISKDNDFIDYMTVEELNRAFGSENPAKTWAEVREGWPAEEIKLFSPGADSGTYDYFNEVIFDKKGARNDSQIAFSEDDNTLVQGVAGNKYGIGFFGLAYYEENADKLNVVPIDGGSGPVTPTLETVKDNSYAPLSRPLFVYFNKKELEREEVKAFADYYISHVANIATEVGYIPMPAEKYEAEAAKLK